MILWMATEKTERRDKRVYVHIYTYRGIRMTSRTNLERGRERGRKRRQGGKEGDTASLPFSNFPFLLGHTVFPSFRIQLCFTFHAIPGGGGFLAPSKEEDEAGTF